jgi:hypothetical protein
MLNAAPAIDAVIIFGSLDSKRINSQDILNASFPNNIEVIASEGISIDPLYNPIAKKKTHKTNKTHNLIVLCIII